MADLQPPRDGLRTPRTRPFTGFTVLAVIFGAAGVVQLFINIRTALATFGFVGLMLLIRDILRRSVPPE